MNIKLDGEGVASVLAALVQRGAALGLDVRMPDGIDVTITNEVLWNHGGGRETAAFVAPKQVAIRWHYKDGAA